MQLFRNPEYLKVKKPQIERIAHVYKTEKDRDDKPTFTPPPDDLLNTPLTTNERYDLAVAIDTLPPELLGEVIEILSKALDFRRDQEFDIPFSSLDTPTLRTIEAYVKHAKEQEQIVRRMFQNETIPAEKQLEILEEELQRIKKRLNEKHPQTSASEFTSENDSLDDTSGATTGSESESTSGSTGE
jgi:hypothetical protein